MAWLYKQAGSDNWWIGQRVNGRQIRKSTGTSDKTEAQKKLAAIEAMERAAAAGCLTEEFFRALTGAQAQKPLAIKAAVKEWHEAHALSRATKTAERYKDVLEQFLLYLKADDARPLLRDVGNGDVTGFLNQSSKTLSRGSLILTRKILSAFFNWCVKGGKATSNPVRGTKVEKARKGDKVQRRAFTMQELKDLWTHAPDDFWRYMLTGGLYTGLRMGDLICLAKDEVDLSENKLRLTTLKTGTEVKIPIAAPFRKILEPLVKKCHGKYLWPTEAAYYKKEQASPFSQDFYELVMVKAGLVPKRSHVAKTDGNGRRQRHNVSALTFHCLRHTFVSLLKTSGVSQAVAKELAAHASDKISDMYTHVATEHMEEAIKLLPNVTAEAA
jgi:integrase